MRQGSRAHIEALRWFVATRYLQGADECSIAARGALLNLAEHFEQDLVSQGRCNYSSRITGPTCA